MTATRLRLFLGLLVALAVAAPARGQSSGASALTVSTGPVVLGYAPPPPAEKPAANPAKPGTKKPARRPAAKPAPRRVLPGPCDADAKSYCADAAKKGRRALHACLLAHRDRISPRCRAFSTPDVAVACRNEIGLLCGGAKSGGAAQRACLTAHESVATTECRNALDDSAPAKN